MAETSTIARPYAEALFRVATEGDETLLTTWTELVSSLGAVSADPGMQQLIGDPRVTPDQLYGVFAGALGTAPDASISKPVENFIRTLIDNDRLAVLPEISTQFSQLVDEKQGSAEATITSAFPMSDADVASLVAALERKFAVKLKATVDVDESLIGGVRVVVGDRVLDTSVSSRLERMRAALTA